MTPAARFAVYCISLIAALILQLLALPDAIAAGRPIWVLMMLAYWTLAAPRIPHVLFGFIAGLIMDVMLNTPLGQHAVAMVVAVYAVDRLRPLFNMFPAWQATLVLVPVWGVYEFLLFWIDGLTHHLADPMMRWLPVATTTVAWPILWLLLGAAVRIEDPPD
jgi:rod shape-determining protein MreD